MRVLYKKTSTGATQCWYKEIEGSKHRTVSGQLDGKQVTSEWTQAVGKNVGRSNETSAEEQAILEVEAAYTKKLAQGGYHESIDDIATAKYFKPMLAKNYNDYTLNFKNQQVYSQPKLDGVRCIATADGLWTRQGKPIEAVPHISDALKAFFTENPDAILDGELYADKLSDNFNEIISLVRKQKPSVEHFAKTAGVIQYHIYDFPSIEESFVDRYNTLFSMLFRKNTSDHLVQVETTLVISLEHLDKLMEEYLLRGYEGQMVRLDGPYKNGRSADLLKRKEFIDNEYKIISINEGVGNRSGMAGFITYELGDGRTFNSGIKGTHSYCVGLLNDAASYVGGEGTVKSFGLTPDGIPRFPVTIGVYTGKRDL